MFGGSWVSLIIVGMGYRTDKVWYNSEYYRKELAELC